MTRFLSCVTCASNWRTLLARSLSKGLLDKILEFVKPEHPRGSSFVFSVSIREPAELDKTERLVGKDDFQLPLLNLLELVAQLISSGAELISGASVDDDGTKGSDIDAWTDCGDEDVEFDKIQTGSSFFGGVDGEGKLCLESLMKVSALDLERVETA